MKKVFVAALILVSLVGCVRRTDGGLVDRAYEHCSQHKGIDSLETSAGFENSPIVYCKDGAVKRIVFDDQQTR